ncbi:translation initiation factor 2 [Emergencia sp. 1XD21-10]|uniref:translation initiation factor 2 n=1 Tax=Emergencia sp. 1XD21-10 TaxID=2304569 RepID=UPI00137AE7ED|nr:translation initiation factor 2 [Emergencia sp. 1XD21-10]
MKGKYTVVVKNRRLQYKFSIERNITVLKGDSATGKTTLIDMIASYQQNGEASGITLNCEKSCTVLTGLRWQENLSLIYDSIVFIDEGDRFVLTDEFASAIQGTDNYYVIATRAPLFNLPYSVNEIYGIRNTAGNRYQGTKRLYAEFYNLCDVHVESIPKPELVVVEDSNAGYQFFADFFSKYDIPCVSAQGKSGIYQELLNQPYSTALVIADGAAFGPEIERVLSLQKVKNLIIYLPESFEWMILKSGILQEREIQEILDAPFDYIESKAYFSWEQFFTALLVNKTSDTAYLKYSKSSLNKAYLNTKEQTAIINVMPDLWLK